MEISKVCSDLVKIKSENPPGKTKEVADYIGNILKSLGISFKTTDDGAGRCNIYTDYNKQPLMFMGHMDVVPALNEGWERDPFSGEISGGYVFGRGSTDMKGGCAAILCAISDIIEKGITPPCNLCFVCDEENGGDAGIRYLLKKRLISHPCDCVIAEPTPCLNPAIGQKGLFRAKIDFTGEPGHGSLYPGVGKSAIMSSVEFLSYIKLLNLREFANEENLEEIIMRSSLVLSDIFGIDNADSILRKITYNPGIICGGEEINIVAQRCSLNLEMRIPWGCDVNKIKKEMYENNPSAKMTIFEFCGPTFTESESKIVNTACREIENVYGVISYPIVQWAASDARYLRDMGFNVIEYGPGDIKTIHGIDERVSVENLKKTVEIYKGILKEYC